MNNINSSMEARRTVEPAADHKLLEMQPETLNWVEKMGFLVYSPEKVWFNFFNCAASVLARL